MVPRATMPSDAPQAPDGPLSAEASTRLDRLYRLHADRVLRLAYQRTGDRHLAQDIAGETWVQASTWITTLQADDEAAFGWLATIVKRAVAAYYRRPSNSEKPTDWDDPVAGFRLPRTAAADDVLLADPLPELPAAWQAMLDKLPPVQREALMWRIEGLSWRAVASHVQRDHTTAARAARRGARVLAGTAVA